MNVQFFALAKRPNSTARPNLLGGSNYTDVQLKGPCSIRNPIIEIRMSAGSDPIGFNYCYIAAFERYYFVDDWVNDGYLWNAHLVEDELATFKDEIGSSTQYILRSSHTGDGDIVDEMYPMKAVTNTYTSTHTLYDPDFSNGSYVVGIINKDAANNAGNMGCVKYYVFTSAGLRAFMGKLFNDNITGFNPATSNLEESVYKSLFNPIEYITSCMFFPFTPVTGSSVTSITYGYWTMTGITGCDELSLSALTNITGSLGVQKHPQAATRGSYLNLKPYTNYTLFIPPFGQYPLDPMLLHAVDTLYFKITTDPISGQAYLKLYLDNSYNVLIMQDTAQLGIPIALAQMSRDYVGAATSALGGAAGAITSGLMGNIPGAIAGGLSAVGSVAGSLMPQLQTKGANGAFISLVEDAYLTAQCIPVVDRDNANLGTPLCTSGQVSSYPGYLLCAEPDIAINEATRAEMDAIRNYMSTGFFYE